MFGHHQKIIMFGWNSGYCVCIWMFCTD